MVAERIVSLLPAATEIVCALGLADRLVGVTFECDEPAGVRHGCAVLVGGLDTHGLSAAEIDALVTSTVSSGQDLYRLDVDAFRRCDPDLVLTQDLCRVCALPSGRVDDAMAALGCSAEVVSLDPHSLDEVLAMIVDVAHAAGVAERGEQMVGSLRARLAAVAAAVAGRPRPRVFVLEWTDPPFVAGHWVPELVTRAGGDAVLATPGGRSARTTWEAVAAAAPEVVIVAPCGFGLRDAVAQADSVLDRLPPNAQVWAIDANACVVRPGPRLVDGVEAIACALHGMSSPAAMSLVARVRPLD
jgi:iron complex transport system substrate-binding protein